jgi:hypothetical protein
MKFDRMRLPGLAAVMVMAGIVSSPIAMAQDKQLVPPQNAMKLSEIIAKVEQRSNFHYIDDIDWDDGGYEVTYYTNDKAKVEIKFDPVSGEPK